VTFAAHAALMQPSRRIAAETLRRGHRRGHSRAAAEYAVGLIERGELDLTPLSTHHLPLERYDEVDPRLREKWEEELSAAIEAEYRRQRAELVAGLQWWLRDVWLQTLAAPGDLLRFSQLKRPAESVAKRISPKDAWENLQVLEQTQRLLYTNVQEALALEVGLLKLKL